MKDELKRAGIPHVQTRAGLHKAAKEVYDDMGTVLGGDGEAFRKQMGVRPTALIAARRAGRGGPKHRSHGRAIMLASFTRGPKVTFDLCPACRRLLISTTAGGRWPSLHKACGGAEPAQRDRGRPIDRATLTRDFGWAMHHRLGHEALSSIAVEASLSKVAVRKAIQRIVDLLPGPGVGGKRLQAYAAELRRI